MYRLSLSLRRISRSSQARTSQAKVWQLLVMYVHLSCMELMKDFSNTLSKQQIEEMATVDEFEVVKEVQVSPRVEER
jgi:hypothetical protein